MAVAVVADRGHRARLRTAGHRAAPGRAGAAERRPARERGGRAAARDGPDQRDRAAGTGTAAGAGCRGEASGDDLTRVAAAAGGSPAGQTLAVAESLTGGLVAAELTAVPGSLRAFRGSVTAYATELKQRGAGRGRGTAGRARARWTREVAPQMARGRTDGRSAPTGASRPPVWPVPNRRTGSRSERSSSLWRPRPSGPAKLRESGRRCG